MWVRHLPRWGHISATRLASGAVLNMPVPTAKGDPQVSVVIVSCNRAALLAQTVRSVLQQNIAVECIVVDDSSDDPDTNAYLAKLAASGDVKVIQHSERSGLPAARNSGLMNAQGRYITFLDDDDYLCRNSLSKRLQAPQPSYCDWISISPDDNLGKFVPLKPAAKRGDIDRSTVRWKPPFIASAPLLDTDKLIEFGGFNESLDRAEDTELWFRMIRDGQRFSYVKHIGVAYRRSPNSMVTGAPLAQLEALESLTEILEPAEVSTLGHVDKRIELLEQSITYLIMSEHVGAKADPTLIAKLLPESLRGTVAWERAEKNGVPRAARRLGISTEAAQHALDRLLETQTRNAGEEPSRTKNPKIAWTGHRPPGTEVHRIPEWRKHRVDTNCLIRQL